MALNFADAVAVRAVVVSRVASSCVQYALYLLGLGTSTTEQLAWARGTMDAPSVMGDRVSWYLLDDPNYLASGSGITDQQLDAAVQTAVNAYFIPGA